MFELQVLSGDSYFARLFRWFNRKMWVICLTVLILEFSIGCIDDLAIDRIDYQLRDAQLNEIDSACEGGGSASLFIRLKSSFEGSLSVMKGFRWITLFP